MLIKFYLQGENMIQYILNDKNQVKIGNKLILTNSQILDAVHYANNAISEIHKQTNALNINIFEILGLRNLSGFVGEIFVKSVEVKSNETLHTNLHQDGYPDLLLVDTAQKKGYFDTLYDLNNGKKCPKDKALFSPYLHGGLEVKATCGSTPPASKKPKPQIGEQRIAIMNSFDWKAHHRETNNLLGILWDFIDELPTIVAVFYCDDLSVEDWGKIVQPKEGAGRTTSVSIMNSGGIRKMCDRWVAVIDDDAYTDALSKKKWIGTKV